MIRLFRKYEIGFYAFMKDLFFFAILVSVVLVNINLKPFSRV